MKSFARIVFMILMFPLFCNAGESVIRHHGLAGSVRSMAVMEAAPGSKGYVNIGYPFTDHPFDR